MCTGAEKRIEEFYPTILLYLLIVFFFVGVGQLSCNSLVVFFGLRDVGATSTFFLWFQHIADISNCGLLWTVKMIINCHPIIALTIIHNK